MISTRLFLLAFPIFLNACSAMHHGAKTGDLDAISAAAKSGKSVNQLDWQGQSVVGLATANNKVEILAGLVDLGADINLLDAQLKSPLMIAVEKGHIESAKELLRLGAKVDLKKEPEGFSSLFLATQNGNLELVRLLLSSGANPQEKTNAGAGIIQFVIAGPHKLSPLKGYEFLSGFLAEIKDDKALALLLNEADSNSVTPLHHAINDNNIALADLLLSKNAKVNTVGLVAVGDVGSAVQSQQSTNSSSVLGFLFDPFSIQRASPVSKPAQSAPKTYESRSPLHSALLLCGEDGGLVKKLLDKGADIRYETKEGYNTVNLLMGCKSEGLIEPLKELLRVARKKIKPADFSSFIDNRPLFKVRQEDDKFTSLDQRHLNKTPLLFAAEQGRLETAKLLVEGGAQINFKDPEGNSALMLAIQNKNPEMVKYLIQRKADFKFSNKTGESAYVMAFKSGVVSVVEMLIDAGISVQTEPVKENLNLLYVASAGGNIPMMELALRKKSKVDQMFKISPLGIAAQNGHLEAVKLLITHKANPNLQFPKHSNTTAAYLAIHSGHQKVYDYLLSVGANPDIKAANGLSARDRYNERMKQLAIERERRRQEEALAEMRRQEEAQERREREARQDELTMRMLGAFTSTVNESMQDYNRQQSSQNAYLESLRRSNEQSYSRQAERQESSRVAQSQNSRPQELVDSPAATTSGRQSSDKAAPKARENLVEVAEALVVCTVPNEKSQFKCMNPVNTQSGSAKSGLKQEQSPEAMVASLSGACNNARFLQKTDSHLYWGCGFAATGGVGYIDRAPGQYVSGRKKFWCPPKGGGSCRRENPPS